MQGKLKDRPYWSDGYSGRTGSGEVGDKEKRGTSCEMPRFIGFLTLNRIS